MIDGNQLREEFGRYLAEHKATRWGMDAALMHVCKIAYDAGKADGPGEALYSREYEIEVPAEPGLHPLKFTALLAHIQRGVVPEDLRMRLVEAWDYGQFADDFDQPLAKRIRADIRALCELLAGRVEVQVNPTASAAGWHLDELLAHILRGAVPEGWHLDESEAALLHHLTSPDDDRVHPPITLRVGNVRMDDGVVKFGLLCEYTDYPDEGATLLVERTETAPDHFRDAAPDQFRDAAKMMAEPAEVPMPQVRWATCPETDTPCSHCPTKRIPCQAMTAPAEVPMPEPDVVGYVERWGGACPDCADESGVCPSSGMPCGGARKAIEYVIRALQYGVTHGYISNPIKDAALRGEGK